MLEAPNCSKKIVFEIVQFVFASTNLNLLSLCSIRVIVRGILVHLSALYQPLLELRREVAKAQPMPFLTDFSLPAVMAQFLGPSDALLLPKKPACVPQAKDSKEGQHEKKKSSVKAENRGKTRKVKEDLGVAIERGVERFHCSVF